MRPGFPRFSKKTSVTHPNATQTAWRLLGGATLAMFLFTACSIIVDTEADQCSTDADCQAKGAAFIGSICSAEKICTKGGSGGSGGSGGATTGSCSTNKDCSEQSGDLNQICRKSDHTCISLTSQDCTQVLGSVQDDNTILLGLMAPLVGDYATTGLPILAGAALARSEFETRANGLPGGSGGKRRPLAIVACHDLDDPIRTAEHLIQTVGVPAIIGPAFSGVTIKVATEEAIPNNILLISASATSPEITKLEDNNLVWRTVPSDAIQAIPLASLAGSLEAKIREELKLGKMEKIKVAMTVKGDAYGAGLADAVLQKLQINGASIGDPSNNESFLRADYPDDANYDYTSLLNNVVNFHPHIVISLGTNEAIQKIVTGVEKNWPDTGTPPPRPRYLLPDGGEVSELLDLIGQDDNLRARIIGTVPGKKGPLYNNFRIRFKAANQDADPGAFAENGYDAFYLLSYAITATTGEPVDGPTIAKGFSKLVPEGIQIDADPNKINDAFTALKGGGNINFNGASGPLDFDLTTGDAPADIDIWCVTRDSKNTPIFKSSGQYYDAAKGLLVGTPSCD